MRKPITSNTGCANCLFWSPKPGGNTGTCHFNPPAVVAEVVTDQRPDPPEMYSVVNTVWPETNYADICGKYQDVSQ